MKKDWRLLWFSLLLFLIFVLLSVGVRNGWFLNFDWRMTVWLQSVLNSRLDIFFSLFSVLGSFDVACVFLLVLVLCLYFSRRKAGSILSLVFFLFILVFELYGKIFIRHPSPPAQFARYIHFFTLPTENLPHPSYSFPSGHSIRTLFLSTILVFLLWKGSRLSRGKKILLTILLIAYDFIMLVSRVVLGEHWTSDVIGGVFLGMALGGMTVWGITAMGSMTSRIKHKRMK